jgi:hypothetical protein
MHAHRRPQVGDIVTAYRIRHPFIVSKILDELDAAVLEYPNGEFTRLIPLDAIEPPGESAARRWTILTQMSSVRAVPGRN